MTERPQAATRQAKPADHTIDQALLRDPVTACVALGANLGDTGAALRQALQALDGLPLTRVSVVSGIYQTAPMASCGGHEAAAIGPDYCNSVALLTTGLAAPALLDQLQRLEQQAGRERPYRNAPRTLDLDLLLYGSARIESARLSVPHPRMMQRAFVLVPLAEIAPGCVSAEALAAVQHQHVRRLGDLAICQG